VHEQAAAALSKLCWDDRRNRVSVRECGGIAALVGLLAPGMTDAVHQEAAAALRSVCGNHTHSCISVR